MFSFIQRGHFKNFLKLSNEVSMVVLYANVRVMVLALLPGYADGHKRRPNKNLIEL